MDSYVLVVVPPEKILVFADNLRRKYAKYTSYVIPPHLTIYPPFYSKYKDERELIEVLNISFLHTRPARISFGGVGCFEGKNKVVYFEPNEESKSYLKGLLVIATQRLHSQVRSVYDDYNFTPERFNPHMTIAEHIPEEDFPGIKEALENKNIKQGFECNSIFLYKQGGNSTIWNKTAEIAFSENP